MPQKEIVREILETLQAQKGGFCHIESMPQWWESPNYDEYAEALQWLSHKCLIDARETEELGWGDRQYDIFHAKINAAGREYLANNCEFEPQKIVVSLDGAQLKEIIVALVGNIEGTEKASFVGKTLKKIGDAGVNAFASELVKYVLTHLPKVT